MLRSSYLSLIFSEVSGSTHPVRGAAFLDKAAFLQSTKDVAYDGAGDSVFFGHLSFVNTVATKDRAAGDVSGDIIVDAKSAGFADTRGECAQVQFNAAQIFAFGIGVGSGHDKPVPGKPPYQPLGFDHLQCAFDCRAGHVQPF